MRLKTLLLGALAAGITANLYSKSRRKAVATLSDAGAERLQDDETLGTPDASLAAGTLPMAEGQDNADTDPMFGSSSQHGTAPIGTGLSDFSRGA